jgi:hypothetical protein
MIEFVTGKDLSDMWIKIQELIERTKKHTKQIQELERKLKEVK